MILLEDLLVFSGGKVVVVPRFSILEEVGRVSGVGPGGLDIHSGLRVSDDEEVDDKVDKKNTTFSEVVSVGDRKLQTYMKTWKIFSSNPETGKRILVMMWKRGILVTLPDGDVVEFNAFKHKKSVYYKRAGNPGTENKKPVADELARIAMIHPRDADNLLSGADPHGIKSYSPKSDKLVQIRELSNMETSLKSEIDSSSDPEEIKALRIELNGIHAKLRRLGINV
jgi:hypothetical protein